MCVLSVSLSSYLLQHYRTWLHFPSFSICKRRACNQNLSVGCAFDYATAHLCTAAHTTAPTDAHKDNAEINACLEALQSDPDRDVVRCASLRSPLNAEIEFPSLD